MDGTAHLAVIGGMIALVGVFIMFFVKFQHVDPKTCYFVQGVRKEVRTILYPGRYRWYFSWEKIIWIDTRDKSVNIGSETATTWIQPENATEPAYITVKANEISIEFRFRLTGDKKVDIQNARDFLAVKDIFFKDITDENGMLKTVAGEQLQDHVQGAFRRYCADPFKTFKRILFDDGGIKSYLLTELRANQRGCVREREIVRKNLFKDKVREIKEKAQNELREADKFYQGLSKQGDKDAEDDLKNEINRIKEELKARLKDTDAIWEVVDREIPPYYDPIALEQGIQRVNPDVSFWGCTINKVAAIEEIQAADPELRKVIEKEAKIIFEERAAIAEKKKIIKETEHEITITENQAKAEQAKMTVLATALNIPDEKMPEFFMNWETLKAMAQGIGGGNTVNVGNFMEAFLSKMNPTGGPS